MSLRLTGYLILLVLLVTFTVSMTAPSQQAPRNPVIERPFLGPKWEYKVLRLESYSCSSENDMTRSLNALGQQGWELVGYQQSPPPFPREAEGSLLIAPAATGPNRGVNPPTADSFQGNLDLKMAQVPPPGCSMLLKREWFPSTRQ